MVVPLINRVEEVPAELRILVSLAAKRDLYFPSIIIYNRISEAGLRSLEAMVDKIVAYVSSIRSIRTKIEVGGLLGKIKDMILDVGQSDVDVRSVERLIAEHRIEIAARRAILEAEDQVMRMPFTRS